MDWQGAQPGPSAFDHADFVLSPSGLPGPTVGLPAGGTLFFEINYSTSAIASTFESISITFFSESDIEGQLKAFMELHMGGVWTATAETVGGDIRIADLTGIASPDRQLILFITDDDGGAGNFTDHTHTKSSYIDPWVAEAIALMDSTTFNTTDFSTCVWYGEAALVTGSGTGTLEYTFQIQPTQITLDIEILDNLGQQVGAANYSWVDLPLDPGGYQCDRYYPLQQRSSSSRDTPTSFPFGPAPVPVIDWSGSVISHMNLGAGLPLPPGTFCVKPISSLGGTDIAPVNPGNVTVVARTTTANLGETIGAETLWVVGFTFSRQITMPLCGDRLDLSDWEGQTVQIQYKAFDTCVGGEESDQVIINIAVPAWTNRITVNPLLAESGDNYTQISRGIAATLDGGLCEVFAGTYQLHVPGQNRIRVLFKTITLKFVEPVIIDGNEPNAPAVDGNGVLLLNGAENCLIDGMNNLTITDGNHDSISTGSLTNGTTIKNLDISAGHLFGLELVGCLDTVVVNVSVHDLIRVGDQSQGFLLLAHPNRNLENAILCDCESYNNKDGIVVQAPSNDTVTFINCISRNNARQGVLCEEGGVDFSWIGGSVHDNDGAGIQIENNSNFFVVRGTEVYNNNTYEIDGGCGEVGIWCDDSTDGVIEDNDVHDNGGGIRVDGDGTLAATAQDKSERIIVRRNKVYHNQGGDTACGDCYGIGFRGADHCYAYNNTFWENGRTIGVGQSGFVGANGGLFVLPESAGAGQTNTNLGFRNNILGKTVFDDLESHQVALEIGSEFADLDNNTYAFPPHAASYEVPEGNVGVPFGTPTSGYQQQMAAFGHEANSAEVDPLLNDSTLIPGVGSPVLGASSDLTSITNIAGTTISLALPRYFMAGDVIEFADGTRANIISVSSTAIVVDAVPGTAAVGQGVTLAGLVNIGAVQE